MKVENMTSSQGNRVANQFILRTTVGLQCMVVERFQSYDSIIAEKSYCKDGVLVKLDKTFWDYSKTTGKYRNRFLGENKAETQKKIDSGEYILTDLN